MDAFAAQQQDEGYSEAPLNPSTAPFTLKQQHGSVSALGVSGTTNQLPEWLTRHLATLPVDERTDLAMALLDDLPTGIIAQVVDRLSPRLYIDFIRYLPPEVCLKILGYLDPISLIHVAWSCRAWYDLALDRKLWEKLYYMEGWAAKSFEIDHWEQKVNEGKLSGVGLQRIQSSEYGHTYKKRAITRAPDYGLDHDLVMVDVDATIRQEPADLETNESSLFGGPVPSSTRTGISLNMRDLNVHSSTPSRDNSIKRTSDKGKGRAFSPEPAFDPVRTQSLPRIVPTEDLAGLPKASLWMWDLTRDKYKINWKYLYSVRRRLESNWELGRHSNFQFPHPDFPEEGHGECIYSLQYNAQYLVSGSRDRTLRIWNMHTRRLVRPPLAAHTGSVLCLQFDSDPNEDLIVSGSSDSDVVLWKFSTGEVMQRLRHAHRESVLNVKFDKRILVTCSKDKTIKVFNRRALRHGDLGYQNVDPTPRYAVRGDASALDLLPVTPPYTLIGCLEGHSAAVNAVQIHDREVVSASGDRNIKVWDWPTQMCTRTIMGHNKGIACVQYDGRRIVSGSSDNEVKVFDKHTGIEVASLRSHSALVRTVQAGFGDLPYSVDEDAEDAKRVDGEYFKALESGQLEAVDGTRQSRRAGNAGSWRPEDITAYGAKLPPGGGGGRYGRIVSGSYDTSIIIWRRDKEGIWKDQHHLKQEEAAAAAGRRSNPAQTIGGGSIPLHPSMWTSRRPPPGADQPSAYDAAGSTTVTQSTPRIPSSTLAVSPAPRTQSLSAPPASGRPSTPPSQTEASGLQITQVESPIYATLTPSSVASYQQMIGQAVPQGPAALAQTLASYPSMLTQRAALQAAIDREHSPFVRSQLRQAVNTALMRTQLDQSRQRREAIRALEQQPHGTAAITGETSASGATTDQQHSSTTTTTTTTTTTVAVNPPPPQAQATAAQAAAAAHQAHAQLLGAANGVHLHQLQFDARRIICCSQTSVIVGWDFCNSDPELEEASRFFGKVK